MPSIGDLANVFSRESFSTSGGGGGTRGPPTTRRGGTRGRYDEEDGDPNSSSSPDAGGGEAVELSLTAVPSYSRWPTSSATTAALPPRHAAAAAAPSSSRGAAGRHVRNPDDESFDDSGSNPQLHLAAPVNYHSSWDSDSQFPIREIERIRRKTRKIRSGRKLHDVEQQPSHQQQRDGRGGFDSSDWEEDTLDAKIRAFEEGQQTSQKQQQQSQHRGGSSRRQRGEPEEDDRMMTKPSLSKSTSGEGGKSGTNNSDDPTTSYSSANLGPPTIRRHHAWSDDVSRLSGTQEETVEEAPTTPLYATSRVAQDAARNLIQNFHRPSSASKLLAGRGGDSASQSQPRQSTSNRQQQRGRPPAVPSTKAPFGHPTAHANAGNDTSAETVDESHDGTNNTSTTATSITPNSELQLHDLCGEAVTSDDIAWNNALHLLSMRPELASVKDQGWTPLHICCLASCEPPLFLVRALLYANPMAAQTPDDGGRLPLHLAAASSASAPLMRALVNEHSASVYHVDDHGLTPLHLWLRNLSVPNRLEQAQILLGLEPPMTDERTSNAEPESAAAGGGVVLQRRKQHLNLTLEQLEPMLRRNQRPVVTALNRNLRQRKGRYQKDVDHEAAFLSYRGADVQASLKRLVQWKRSTANHRGRNGLGDEDGEVEAIEVEWPSSDIHGVADQNNPAAIPAPTTLHLPLHTLIYRAIVDKTDLERGVPAASRDANDVVDKPKPSATLSSDDDDDDDNDEEVPTSNKKVLELSEDETYDLLRLFIACHPGALVARDVHGLTPLLVALVEAKTIPPLDVVELLLGSRWPAYSADAIIPEWAADLPMHRVSKSGFGGAMSVSPAMMPTVETRQLPLHLAAEEMPPEMIEVVFEAYPAAREAQDHLGRTPLHVALTSYQRFAVPPRVVTMLYTDRVARIRDDQGRLPFDLLLDRCCAGSSTIPDKPPRAWTYDDVTTEDESPSAAASAVYHRFLSTSIMGAAKPRTRHEAAEFLQRLRCLPPWLREHACSTLVVQDLITDDVTSPWKYFLVLLEGVLIIALITVFRLQMEQFVIARDNQEELSTWYTFAVYATATVRLMLELGRWLVSANLGEFRHLVLFDLSSWITVVSLFLVITTSVLVYGSTSDAELYSLGTATTGMLWLSLFGYLSNWWYGASVFIGGLSKVACSLVWPCLIFGSLIVAFSQMFYTLLQVNCDESIGVPVCTVRDAYRVVYMLVRGETLVDGFSEISVRAIVLVTLLLLSIAFFLVGLFVMLVVASLKLDFESIALRSFWEKKLAFHYTAEDLGIHESKSSSGCGLSSVGVTGRLERAWNLLIVSLIGGISKKRKHWHEGVPASDVLPWPLWIVAIFVIPLWVVLGAVTLGLLWPPQLRSLLFRPFGFHSERGGQASVQQTAINVTAMRDEVRQLKILSFERSGEMERELRELKELLHSAIKES